MRSCAFPVSHSSVSFFSKLTTNISSGNFDSTVKFYQNWIKRLECDNTRISATNEELKEENRQWKAQIDEIEAQKKKARGTVNRLKNEIKKLKQQHKEDNTRKEEE